MADPTPLRTLYENGAFHLAGLIELTGMGLDLRPGTPNRDIIDYLVTNGVSVDYRDGNTVE